MWELPGEWLCTSTTLSTLELYIAGLETGEPGARNVPVIYEVAKHPFDTGLNR